MISFMIHLAKGRLKIRITFADITHTQQVVSFFNKNLEQKNSGIYSNEFFCPLGIISAIRRKQLMVAIADGQVVGAFRFYRKKASNKISLYQFTVSEGYRGKRFVKKDVKNYKRFANHCVMSNRIWV